ncbi:MAG: ABC transporter ATP-binding protein [Chitinophagaceae bacterium]|nr:ABC transporter ATP-binding protein [Chitinophagaceae bacterium]
MALVLELEHLVKHYGNIHALKGVTLQIPAGTVYGILGPNGSGKTTMLGLIMNILQPTSGSIRLFGETPSASHRRKIGTLLETPNFYHYLSAVQNLRIAAAIKGIHQPDIDGVLQRVNLLARKDSPFSTYSLGMKQRLAIASCLLGDPQVMVFDEPTNGLDPVGIAEIRDLIKKLATEGKTIIMASHLLDEVEKVCTHVAILKKGELIASGHVDEILAHDDIVEVGAADPGRLLEVLRTMPGQTGVHAGEGDKATIHFAPGTADLATLNHHCFVHGVLLNHLQQKKKSLESKFIELTN